MRHSVHAWPRLRHGAVARPPSLALHPRAPIYPSRLRHAHQGPAAAAAGGAGGGPAAAAAAPTPASSSSPPSYSTAAQAQAAAAAAAAAAGAGAASWPLLYRASRVASFSGLCYIDTSTGSQAVAELERRAAALGLSLVAHGRCPAAGGTSWVVGDATIDYGAFSRRAGLALSAGAGALPLAPPARRERFVLLRGVQWGAADADVLSLSAALAQVWPTPYPPPQQQQREAGGGGGAAVTSELVAHAGVARLAWALRAEVRAAVRAPPTVPQTNTDQQQQQQQRPLPVVWAGHSLGGSFAKLLWVAEVAEGGGECRRQLQEELQQQQEQARRRRGSNDNGSSTESSSSSPATTTTSALPLPEVLTFGSPPVLAHARGGGSPAMMRALSALAASASASAAAAEPARSAAAAALPPFSVTLDGSRVAQYVLEGDPVPRALLSADPTFASLSQGNGLFSAALRLNSRLFGEGAALTPTRFLFEPLGVVKLVRWSPSGGSEVVPLVGSAEEVSRALMAAAAGIASKPAEAEPGESAADAAAAAAAVAAAQRQQQQQQQQQDVAAAKGGAGAGAGAGAGPAPASWSLFGSLRAWLDHHHGSYTQELEAAAISALRAEQRRALLERQGRAGGGGGSSSAATAVQRPQGAR
jgi:hypothetical protein